jgi:FkbM family methyltransferase
MIEHEFGGVKFYFEETFMAKDLITEIFSDNYKVLQSKLVFGKGDTILDVGACEGMFSILMAKCFPEARIISLEPVPRTYATLLRNIELNGVNIEPHNIGLGKINGKVQIFFGKKGDSGGSSSFMTFNPKWHEKAECDIITLDEAFQRFNIDKVKLMKCDTEGAEYDILYNGEESLKKVEYYVGEQHINARLDYDGRRIDGLANWLSNRVKILCIESCRMAD